ncbi:MAG: BON domain-containing protein [Planctomycetota bacterium]
MITHTGDLSARISTVVASNPFLNSKKIHFRTDGSRVVIRGRVETFFRKQMAQEAVRDVEGVESIDNQLEVSWR